MKDVKKGKKDFFQIIKCIILITLLFKATSEMVCSAEQLYDVSKGIGLWRGMCFLGLALSVVFVTNYKNMFIYAFVALYFILVFIIMHGKPIRTESPELWKWITYRLVALGTIIPSLVSAICERRFKIIHRKKSVPYIVLLLLGIYVYIADLDRMNLPFVVLFFVWCLFIRIEEKQKNELMICLMVSIYLCAIYTFIKSLIKVPYNWEINYKGIFSNSTTFSPFMGLGFVSVIGLFSIYSKGLMNIRNKYLIFLAIFSAPIIISLVIINNRNVFLALIIVIFLATLIFYVRHNKAKKMIAVTIFFATCVITFIFICFLIFNLYGKEAPGNPIMFRLWKTAMTLTKTDSKIGVIPENSVLNPIDWLLSGRLSIWIQTIRQLHFFKGNSTLIYVTYDYQTGVHNTFLGFLNMYGIIFGLMIIIPYIASLIMYCIKMKNEVKNGHLAFEKNYYYFYASFYMIYCLSIFVNEMFYISTFYNVIYLLLIALMSVSDDLTNQKIKYEQIEGKIS